MILGEEKGMKEEDCDRVGSGVKYGSKARIKEQVDGVTQLQEIAGNKSHR